ncbi:hypothetical protein AWC16_10825 [Mycolicibacter longobardus]|uniref:Uncharacterized protein n=1 Tax=Mycolicibacter longobardus TaxID=1108812 RepID=A0A1X1YKN7_9MYCO|nr:hypothetical protein AWC16_10825 [Mycolicibacter longobardus]
MQIPLQFQRALFVRIDDTAPIDDDGQPSWHSRTALPPIARVDERVDIDHVRLSGPGRCGDRLRPFASLADRLAQPGLPGERRIAVQCGEEVVEFFEP